MCFCEICVIVVIFSCELFSWEQFSWSLYCDSLVASHIIDHGKRWFKLRPRCFVNSQLLWRYWRWRICSSIWRIFAYWKFPRLSVDEWSDVEYKTELRFAKKHLPELCECLGIPEKITCVQRTVCGGMEGLCILLKRLAYPCRYTDMVPRFGRNPTELCLIFNTMIDFIYGNHKHRLNVLVLH